MKLTYKKGRLDKVHISIDGEYRLTVDENYFQTFQFSQNCEISALEYEELAKKVNFRRAYNKAIELLSRREHSRKEIFMKLKEKGFEDVAHEICDCLEERDYLNDERFARLYSKELKERRAYGKNRIKQELYRKGISAYIIDDILPEREEDNTERIIALIKKKYPYFNLDEKTRNRAVNALIRYGYSFSDIKKAMEYLTSEEI